MDADGNLWLSLRRLTLSSLAGCRSGKRLFVIKETYDLILHDYRDDDIML